MRKYYIGVLVLAVLSSVVFSISVSLLIPKEPVYVEKFVERPQIKIPVSTYVYKFGKSSDSLVTIHEVVKRNETFLQILNKYKVPSDRARELLVKSKELFNFRNITAGSKYTVYQTPDSNAQTRWIVYEANPRETLILRLDSLSIIKEEKKIQVIRKGISGKITSSLYESLMEQEAPTQLAYELSKIFATKVDFFKIQEGDNFKIIYDEVVLEGASTIGVKKIHSAYFEHDSQKFYAINFENNGREEFYDEKANGMKQGFLKAPLKYFRISSKFSKRRFHPVQKIFKAHLGTDYAAPTGTPILSVANGTVVEAKYSRFNGNYVKIKHNNTYSTQYLHMSKIAKGMRPGKKVTQGQIIGYVGSTGLATGPHVCFRFWKNNKQVDPATVKATFSGSIPSSKLDDFHKLRKEMVSELDKIPQTQTAADNKNGSL